jgi:hypothetical protein
MINITETDMLSEKRLAREGNNIKLLFKRDILGHKRYTHIPPIPKPSIARERVTNT